MTTFHEAIHAPPAAGSSEGDDPDQVVPALLAIAEAPEEIDMAAALYGDDERRGGAYGDG